MKIPDRIRLIRWIPATPALISIKKPHYFGNEAFLHAENRVPVGWLLNANKKTPEFRGCKISVKNKAYFFALALDVLELEAFFTEVLLAQALLLVFVEQLDLLVLQDLLEQLILESWFKASFQFFNSVPFWQPLFNQL